jgi:hypothetical protein
MRSTDGRSILAKVAVTNVRRAQSFPAAHDQRPPTVVGEEESNKTMSLAASTGLFANIV